jgi:hypothetical protein
MDVDPVRSVRHNLSLARAVSLNPTLKVTSGGVNKIPMETIIIGKFWVESSREQVALLHSNNGR